MCAQYENGLRAEIQEVVCYMEITDFNQLATRCRIFENKHREKKIGGSVGLRLLVGAILGNPNPILSLVRLRARS